MLIAVIEQHRGEIETLCRRFHVARLVLLLRWSSSHSGGRGIDDDDW